MPAVYYPAVIYRSASGFGISFPDFPGCIAAGATVQETAVNGEAALAFHLDGMREDGDAIPSPASLDDIENVDGSEDVARVLVRASRSRWKIVCSLRSTRLRRIAPGFWPTRRASIFEITIA